MAIVIWLSGLALLVVAMSTVAFLPGRSAGQVVSYGDVRLDGEPAVLIQLATTSLWNSDSAGRFGIMFRAPALWWKREMRMLPTSASPSNWTDWREFWRAVATPKPFHYGFEKPDGTRTGPVRIEWDGMSSWNDEGTAVRLSIGTVGFSKTTITVPEQRQWDGAAVTVFAQLGGVVALLWSMLCLLGGLVVFAYRASRPRPARLCRACNYDLRRIDSKRCPECGIAIAQGDYSS